GQSATVGNTSPPGRPARSPSMGGSHGSLPVASTSTSYGTSSPALVRTRRRPRSTATAATPSRASTVDTSPSAMSASRAVPASTADSSTRLYGGGGPAAPTAVPGAPARRPARPPAPAPAPPAPPQPTPPPRAPP